jgi:2-oxoisovalerate dehydrogenase E1 component alpha subunit
VHDHGIQLLSPDGDYAEDPRYPVNLTPDELRALFRDMAFTRRLDEAATALQRQGELGMWIPTLGQEAAQVGSVHAMRPSDFVFPSYREHGASLVRGVEPAELLSLFRGVDFGGWDVNRLRYGLYSIDVGSHPLHAVGYAMGARLDRSDDVVLVYFGDGATSQGAVSEALNFAAVYEAPVVFLCQNNQLAISAHAEKQYAAPLYERARGFGVEGLRVDGNDALAVYAVTRHAADRVRAGGGPVFVEAYTYRLGPHTTADDPTRYRSRDEVEYWEARDPLTRYRRHLEKLGAIDDAWLAKLQLDLDDFGQQVREAVHSLPQGSVLDQFASVYSDVTPELVAQRAWLTDYQDSFLPPADDGATAGHASGVAQRMAAS